VAQKVGLSCKLLSCKLSSPNIHRIFRNFFTSTFWGKLQ